jgi:hypothetical protein
MEVIEHDFGKNDRETVRRFARLMGIVEEHHADILRDPIKHLQAAGKRIAELEIFIRSLQEASRSWARTRPLEGRLKIQEPFRIMPEEYECWQAVKNLLANRP